MSAVRDRTSEELLDELRSIRRRESEIEALLAERGIRSTSRSTEGVGEPSSLGNLGLAAGMMGEAGFLQVLLDTIPNPVFFKDARGVYLGCNDAFASQILGLPKERIIGRSAFDLPEAIPPELARSYQQADRVLLQQTGVQVYENQVRCADGVRREFFFTKATYSDDGVGVAGIVGVMLDITDRKQSEEALRKERDRAQQYLDIAGAIIVALDTDQRVTLINEAGCAMLGCGKEQIIGRSWFDQFVPERMRARLRREHRKLVAGRLLGFESVESSLCTVSGEERRIAWRNALLRDDRQRIIGTLSSGIDITYQKRTEEELQRSEELLINVLESMSEGILVLGKDFQVTYWNRAMEEVSQTSREGVVATGKTPWEIFPRISERGSDLLMKQAMAGEVVRKDDIARKLSDGSWGYTSESYLPLRDERGEIRGIVGMVRDTTERRRLEARLRESEKMEAIGKLAGGVAHDFNNQLAAILGFADMLVYELREQPGLCNHAERIIQAATRSADLVSQLLAFSRRAQYTAKPVDLHEIIDEVVVLLTRSIDKRISIRRELHADPPVTCGDPTLLQSALLNLGINARDAMPEGGELVFTTDVVTLGGASSVVESHDIKPGRYLRIQVTDTGIGMDEATKEHAFEPFFTTKEKGRGTGMGLAAVYGTVNGHGGAIDIVSKPECGTTFTLHLPVVETDTPRRVSRQETEVPTTRQACILIADDEELMRQMLTDLLRSLGHQVVPFEHGLQALRHYQAHWREVDLVILDLDMPKLNGKETLEAMQLVNPGVKALLSSGYTPPGWLAELREESGAAFLRKPFRAVELKRSLQELLAEPEP